MRFTSQDLLLSTSLAVYMATSLIFAAVRWGHKCEPFARHADYYYPAWKALVLCHLSNILMAPAIWMPQEADAVLHLRMLLLLASPSSPRCWSSFPKRRSRAFHLLQDSEATGRLITDIF